MASDYAAIREANKAEYGNVGRWGRDVLVNRYDSSAHFIFELLQNAEDALKRRNGWNGSREVRFELTPTSLRITHCGNPFTLEDVRGVCGVGETTKDLTDIGRFGIGFKSVYAITDRPEVHSGEEEFAIESFVFPVAARPTSRADDQTEFVLPLRSGDADLSPLVLDSLSKLGARTLLFLRQIEEIAWSVNGGASGLYLKEKAEDTDVGSRRVTLIGERKGEPVVEETWLVFSREARTEAGTLAGFIEIAFLLQADKETKEWAVQCVDASPLNAFFPTIVTTHLGFLAQGPYRTTPSRDNVPPHDPWNVKLVQETAALLLDSLGALKSQNLLDVAALQSLPIERTKYPEGSMFAPIFDAVRTALASEPLLPRAGGGWTAAKNARLARTQELRELFDSKQLAALLDAAEEVHWLSGDITRDTASTLRNYLLYELKVTELTPELILPRLTKQFLEAQPNEWILKLYEFLGGQSALVRQGRVSNIPLVRVEGGAHVVAESSGQPQAFLPSEIRTDFPTVPISVCSTAKALEFLKALGLTEPDAVDDVVRNVIPKYMRDTVEADGEEYEADLKRVLNAFATQHRGQRDKLITALKEASFVMSVDTGDGAQYVSKPGDVYLATERLKELFAGVAGVMLVDDSYSCLKGEGIRELLEACGAVRYLRPMSDNSLSWNERSALRVQAGHAETSGQKDQVTDWTLLGLNALLATLPKLEAEERRTKARLIWEELGNLEERSGKGVFTGEYTWTHYGSYRAPFAAAFVRVLNETAWVPAQDGHLQQPRLVLFDSLGWQGNPFLLSKISFKPPILDQLAKEAGIETGVLDLLRKLGVTSEADLRERLGVDDDAGPDGGGAQGDVKDALKQLLGGAPEPTPPVPDPAGQDPVASGNRGDGGGEGTGTGSSGEHTTGAGTRGDGGSRGRGTGDRSAGNKRTPGSAGGRPFISYVAAHPEDEEPDPDGLHQAARMALEEKAIELILSREPEWRRTPTHNPGFDLYQGNEQSAAARWCEVKAMTRRLADRPVGLSYTQFEWAREHGEAYWLYVVECAGTDEARLVRIQNPAGKARTFTFDHGWLDIAETDSKEEPRED
jgi:hypothetical protein